MRDVAVLFARLDSVYKTLEGCDVYDAERDARTFKGGMPVVAHPPCRGWGRMRQWSQATEKELALAPWAVDCLRKNGGVLEHPAHSALWKFKGLPLPTWNPVLATIPEFDEWGGFTIEIEQYHFGHRAEKKTWLYIVGTEIPIVLPRRLGKPTHCIRPTKSYPRLPSVTKKEREATPPALAHWLVELARRTRKPC